MPGVCAVLMSSSVDLTTRTPSNFHLPFDALIDGIMPSLNDRLIFRARKSAAKAGPRGVLCEALRRSREAFPRGEGPRRRRQALAPLCTSARALAERPRFPRTHRRSVGGGARRDARRDGSRRGWSRCADDAEL